MQEVLTNGSAPEASMPLEQCELKLDWLDDVRTALMVWLSAAVAGEVLAVMITAHQRVNESTQHSAAVVGFFLCLIALPGVLVMRTTCSRTVALLAGALFIVAAVILANMT
ncbi:MAG: hypothetical protein ACRD3W_21570 [Terriglobales bacterium]